MTHFFLPAPTLRTSAAVLAAAFLISGCSPVGPDHKTPAMDLPGSFSKGGIRWKKQSSNTQPKPRAWWRLYRDSTLNSLVDKALTHNQDITAAAARLRQARELSKVARSRFFPGIDIGANAERSKSRFRGPTGGSLLQSNFSVPVDFSYELDTWGKVRRQVESARASEGAAVETLNALRLSIAGEVAQTYWALRAVDADRAVFDRTLALRGKSLDLLKAQERAGAISGLDLSRARTEVATAEADRIGLDRDRIELVNALALLTGRAATGMRIPVRTALPSPPSLPVSVPSELLRQRPDIRAAEFRVAAANAEIGVAQAAFYPSFTLNASTGLDSGMLNQLFKADALVWSIGSGVTLPLTNQKRLRLLRNSAVASHAAISAEYRQTVLNAMREVENAIQGTAILARRQKAEDRARASATRTFELSKKRFDSGAISFLDVVDAERSRLDTERRANAVRAERLALSVSLAKALGGQWN